MEKYETCKHVLSVGRTAVYVGTGCPRANMNPQNRGRERSSTG